MALILSTQEQAALAEYQARLLRRFPQRIRRIALFGSKARGDASPESDLDVLVVLSDGQKSRDGFYPLGLTDPAWREIIGMTFDLLMEYGVDISPTVISEDEFEEQPLLVQSILKEGITLWAKHPEPTDYVEISRWLYKGQAINEIFERAREHWKEENECCAVPQ